MKKQQTLVIAGFPPTLLSLVRSMAPGADDGDGYDDLAVGMPGEDIGRYRKVVRHGPRKECFQVVVHTTDGSSGVLGGRFRSFRLACPGSIPSSCALTTTASCWLMKTEVVLARLLVPMASMFVVQRTVSPEYTDFEKRKTHLRGQPAQLAASRP